MKVELYQNGETQLINIPESGIELEWLEEMVRKTALGRTLKLRKRIDVDRNLIGYVIAVEK